jgi:uncharacterized protein YjbI with pentapeptide repeats
MKRPRKSYEESCRQIEGYLGGEIPPLPKRRPQFDDEEPLGVSFFRTLISDDLSDLSLPRTFFGRSEVEESAFRNSDLRESNLCWCDFSDVDFSDAVLADCDLRASIFQRVKFAGADLRRSDLRRSTFEDCSFEGALFSGAILTREQGESLELSETQIAEIAWSDDAGEEPGGG